MFVELLFSLFFGHSSVVTVSFVPCPVLLKINRIIAVRAEGFSLCQAMYTDNYSAKHFFF